MAVAAVDVLVLVHRRSIHTQLLLYALCRGAAAAAAAVVNDDDCATAYCMMTVLR